ncbi:hypothetical protein JCM10212_006687 [Sporobolomyces blumeae]
MSDPATALLERTNALLDAFNSHPLKSTHLTSQVPVRTSTTTATTGFGSNALHGTTDNLTRLTTAGDQTGMSDEGLVVDPTNRERAHDDLKEFKDRVSNLKFAYLEYNARTEFLKHVFLELDENDKILEISQAEIAKVGAEKNRVKAELKVKKERCRELEGLIQHEAEQLEAPLKRKREEAEYAQKLVRECEAMETEIAMLKNKRSPTERMTLSQAADAADAQLADLTTLGQRTIAAERELKELRPVIKSAKLSNERCSNLVAQLEREKKDREDKGEQDEAAEKGCEWVENASKLYKSILGISDTYSLGSGASPRELRIEWFESRTANASGSKGTGTVALSGKGAGAEGTNRILAVELDKAGKFSGAKLVDSSENIQDLVDLYVPPQDVRSFVREVRARIG